MNSNYEKRAQELLEALGSANLKDEPCEMGIDEAGRGPVLGPMVYGAAVWPERLAEQIGKVGFNDSKQVSEKQREQMFASIQLLQPRLLRYYLRVLGAD
jgi:ribonuclease HIII